MAYLDGRPAPANAWARPAGGKAGRSTGCRPSAAAAPAACRSSPPTSIHPKAGIQLLELDTDAIAKPAVGRSRLAERMKELVREFQHRCLSCLDDEPMEIVDGLKSVSRDGILILDVVHRC